MGYKIAEGSTVRLEELMNIIFESIFQTCEKIIQHYEKNENDILGKAGVVFGLAALISASVATHKSEKAIKKAKEDLTELYEEHEPEEVKKEATAIVGKAAVTVAAGVATTFGLALAQKKCYDVRDANRKDEIMYLGSIASMYAERFLRYRGSVANRIGKEAEEEIYYGLEKKTVPVLEDGKVKKKKVAVVVDEPCNRNIICFAPWTSDLYTDEELYGCPGFNRKRIESTFKTLNCVLTTSKNGYLSMNDVADSFHIQIAAEWYTDGFIKGDGYIEYHVREAYEMWEGKYIPIYYIELNSMPHIENRLHKVLPEAPIYK